jgi:hypothetical protein
VTGSVLAPSAAQKWAQFFGANANKRDGIRKKIEGNEAELNDRVFRAFGLNREEIKLLTDAVAS